LTDDDLCHIAEEFRLRTTEAHRERKGNKANRDKSLGTHTQWLLLIVQGKKGGLNRELGESGSGGKVEAFKDDTSHKKLVLRFWIRIYVSRRESTLFGVGLLPGRWFDLQ